MKKHGFGKFVMGAALGAGLGILFAPESGEKTRKELKKKIDELIEKAKEIDIEEVKENVSKKVEELKKEISDLDKEKVAAIASKQAENIKTKANDLVKYAKDKGTPILEDAASAVKEKTIEVLETSLDKLKTEEKKNKTKNN